MGYSQLEISIGALTAVLGVLFVLKEVYQFWRSPNLHFRRTSNVLQFLFVLFTFFTVITLLRVHNLDEFQINMIRIFIAMGVLLGGALGLYDLKKINWFPSFLRIFFQVSIFEHLDLLNFFIS